MIEAITHVSPVQPRRIRLAEERYRRNWSQQDLADLLQTTRLSISRWEQGRTRPTPYYRQRLCELFGLSAEALGLSSSSLPRLTVESKEPAKDGPCIDPTLPAPLIHAPLIGRDTERSQLRQTVFQARAYAALSGLPGIGKTTLALDLVHDPDVRAHFHDGILWARLGATPDFQALFKRWGVLLGLLPEQMAACTTQEEWKSALRNALGTRKMLIVLDDAWSLNDALTCMIGNECAYVLTTRFPQLALMFAPTQAIRLGELDQQESLCLLRHLAPTALAWEPFLVGSIVRAIGGLPLALILLGRALYLQAQTGQPRRLRKLLMNLHDMRQLLLLTEPQAILEGPSAHSDLSVSLQTAIAASDSLLDTSAREAWRAIARVFPARPAHFSEQDALQLCGIPAEVLDTLSDAGILESAGPELYTLHPLLAEYARLF